MQTQGEEKKSDFIYSRPEDSATILPSVDHVIEVIFAFDTCCSMDNNEEDRKR